MIGGNDHRKQTQKIRALVSVGYEGYMVYGMWYMV